MVHLLVINSDPATLRETGHHLRSAGYSAATARSEDEGLDVLEHPHFDAIISELTLVDMNGLELLRRIRFRGLAVPFVLVSAFGRPSSAV
jgi:CheY-like chemotaxis protein